MPGRYVFPGGALEPADRRPSGFPEALQPPPGGIDRDSHAGLAAFARAALRETFEETGLLLGRPARYRPGPVADVWRLYAARGLAPAFADLRLFARAITPPHYPLRFHARYFLAEGRLAQGEIAGDGELEAVAWIPLREVGHLPLPSVTRLVLRQAVLRRRLLRPGQPLRGRVRLFA